MNRKLIIMYLENNTETQVTEIENSITISFGDDQVSMSKELAETIFTQLDKQLHEPTVTCEYMKNELSEKEDIIFTLQEELDEAKQTIEMMQDNMPEAI